MRLSMIVAASENDVIGRGDELPWRLSSDLKRFKSLTMGHPIIMGRKTWDSILRLLPGRTTIIVTRNEDFKVAGAHVVNSLEAAIESAADEEESFVIGGGEIYRQALPLVNRIYLTRVLATVDGDTYLPSIDWENWQLMDETKFSADEKNEFGTRFFIFDRRVS